MRQIINLTAAIALLCVSVVQVSADDTTNTTESDTNMTNQTQDGSMQNTGMDWSQVSRIAKSMMCYLSCRGHSFMSPPACLCPGRNGCESMQCELGKTCKILRGRFATCVKDSSVCDQPKSAVACGQGSRSYYWNKDTSMCERFSSGQCSDNDNGFHSEGECLTTCGSKMGKRKMKGFGKRFMKRFRSRRPGRFVKRN